MGFPVDPPHQGLSAEGRMGEAPKQFVAHIGGKVLRELCCEAIHADIPKSGGGLRGADLEFQGMREAPSGDFAALNDHGFLACSRQDSRADALETNIGDQDSVRQVAHQGAASLCGEVAGAPFPRSFTAIFCVHGHAADRGAFAVIEVQADLHRRMSFRTL